MATNFIGIEIAEYKLVEEIGVGEGSIGKVYRAEREGDTYPDRAIKIVKKDILREGWSNEITKVNKLEGIDGVVQYLNHNSIKLDNEEYLWIMWQYIRGISLKKLIKQKRITIPTIRAVVVKVLEILHACRQEQINHGDLHTGNIIIAEPDRRRLTAANPVWVTDFGYRASFGSGTLDDFCGLNRIIKDCLEIIDFHSLEGEDKQAYTVLKNEFSRYILETNHTEGDYVRNPERLIQKFNELCENKKTSISAPAQRNIQDYLAAELIGDQFDEWKALFVPHFLGINQLLGKNTCVLTGLRGCGKTMIFRRLTALFDLHLGPTGIVNTDTFIGFYLNARNIAEAFPWLPRAKKEDARAQVIHYFHVSWTIEVIKWLKELQRTRNNLTVSWLLEFLVRYFPSIIVPSSENETIVITNLLSHLSAELDNSRLKSSYDGKRDWALSDYQYLEKLFSLIKDNLLWTTNKTIYLFLDDYSTPLVSDVIQEILNPLAFRRSSIIIFKVSTESVESFAPIGLNDKSLEEGHDYSLIDFGLESIQISQAERKKILSAIFKPRIDRHASFVPLNLQLNDILGKNEYDSNSLALKLRGDKKNDGKVLYFGYNFFCSAWSSNVREMISIFANMVSSSETPTDSDSISKAILEKGRVISPKVQDKELRKAGSNYLQLLSSAIPDDSNAYRADDYQSSFGDHLIKIATCFQEIALFEIQNKNSKNLKKNPPKHARRIEIKEIRDFDDDAVREYYKGIIRYGLFLRDNRGKSVRGKAVPRLVLRGILIPYFTLTFSTRDSVTFSWEDFCEFLNNPDTFKGEYIKRQNKLLKKRRNTIKKPSNSQEVRESTSQEGLKF